jgi:GNAT superfamily N-acetyltransferase
MPNYTITLDPAPRIETESVLYAGLKAFNLIHAEPPNRRELSVLLRNDDEVVVGGLAGIVKWNWLFISMLYISDELRGQGFGRALVKKAECEAVAMGCSHAYVDTFSFQARGFYERLGYEVFGQLEDFPPGHTRYFLRKMTLESQS